MVSHRNVEPVLDVDDKIAIMATISGRYNKNMEMSLLPQDILFHTVHQLKIVKTLYLIYSGNT